MPQDTGIGNAWDSVKEGAGSLLSGTDEATPAETRSEVGQGADDAARDGQTNTSAALSLSGQLSEEVIQAFTDFNKLPPALRKGIQDFLTKFHETVQGTELEVQSQEIQLIMQLHKAINENYGQTFHSTQSSAMDHRYTTSDQARGWHSWFTGLLGGAAQVGNFLNDLGVLNLTDGQEQALQKWSDMADGYTNADYTEQIVDANGNVQTRRVADGLQSAITTGQFADAAELFPEGTINPEELLDNAERLAREFEGTAMGDFYQRLSEMSDLMIEHTDEYIRKALPEQGVEVPPAGTTGSGQQATVRRDGYDF